MKLSGRSARRIMMFGLAAVGAISGFTAQASEDYPNRPVRVLVGFAAGGATDLIARTVAQGSMPFCVEANIFTEPLQARVGLLAGGRAWTSAGRQWR